MRNLFALASLLVLSGCAEPHVVQIVNAGDDELNCAQLQTEIGKLEVFRDEAKSEKGVTWGNAGRALVFPIGIWATYDNANEAIDAANQREVYLRGLMNKQDC